MGQGKQYKPSDADRLFVERAVMAGTKIQTIAECLNLHDDTLRKHYRYEIVTGRERLKGDAVRVLIDSLTDNSLDAAKYVLSRVAGWRETNVNEHSGPGGGPVQTEDVTAREALVRSIIQETASEDQTGGAESSDDGST